MSRQKYGTEYEDTALHFNFYLPWLQSSRGHYSADNDRRNCLHGYQEACSLGLSGYLYLNATPSLCFVLKEEISLHSMRHLIGS